MSKKKVAIVGMAQSTRDQAPWDDESYEIWILNEMGNPDVITTDEDGEEVNKYGFVERWDRLIQIHERWDFTREHNHNDPDHFVWLQQEHGKPIYMQEEFEDIPDAVEYPFEAVVEEFLDGVVVRGPEDSTNEYFTCSLAYMIALALLEGFERIELYGFEMASDTEFMYQRDGVSFWLGIATGRRVQVWLPDGCQLLQGTLYGYETGTLIPKQRFVDRKEELEEKHDALNNNMELLSNRWGFVRQSLKAKPKNPKERERLSKEANVLARKLSQLRGQLNTVGGAIRANEHWIERAEDINDSGIREHIRRQHIEIYNKAVSNELEEVIAEANRYAGEIGILKDDLKKVPDGKGHKNERRRLEKLLNKRAMEKEKAMQKGFYLTGMKQENRRWILYTDQRLKKVA